MNKRKFIQLIDIHIDALNVLINQHMRDDGDVEVDSQKMCLLNRLNAFENSVNGVHETDMKSID